MKILQRIVTLAAVVLFAQTATASGPLDNPGTPFEQLQAQLDSLNARTQALEDSAGNLNVEGRTYCSMLELTIMRGRANDASEELQTNIVRRKVSFADGLFTGNYVSNVLNNQTDAGVVEHPAPTIIDPLLATYTQTGSKLDITFSQGPTANWYASKDGSVIFGSKIDHAIFGGGTVTVGFVRSWTMIETDPLDSCDGEGL